jgi:hypothetical protein
MQHRVWAAVGRSAFYSAVVVMLASCASMSGESASSALQRADSAMGGTALKSISFAGSGAGATFGQAYLAGQAWPKITIQVFRVSLTMKTPHSGKTPPAPAPSPMAAVPFR